MKNVEPRFRTQYDPGPYNDSEPGGGEQVTDPSLDVSTTDLINRLLRGQSVGARFVPVYEADSSDDPDGVIDNLDPTRESGFDLADTAPFLETSVERQNARKRTSEKPRARNSDQRTVDEHIADQQTTQSTPTPPNTTGNESTK